MGEFIESEGGRSILVVVDGLVFLFRLRVVLRPVASESPPAIWW
jgi:hypothetical protein